MKKVFARIVSEILFYLGALVSYLTYCAPQFYCLYNRLMGWSLEVQFWGENEKPWRKVEGENDDRT